MAHILDQVSDPVRDRVSLQKANPKVVFNSALDAQIEATGSSMPLTEELELCQSANNKLVGFGT